MSFFEDAFQVFLDVTSLGGTYRLRALKDRYERLREIHERLTSSIAVYQSSVAKSVFEIEGSLTRARSHMKKAQRMLSPLGYGDPRFRRTVGPGANASLVQSRSTLARSGDLPHELKSTALGVAAGMAAPAAWGAVQILAHASTGAAMAGLHGAAATSAGWAWFGGGSLAAGGGGMALGHILLPGVGTAIAVSVSTFVAHSDANKVAAACEELGIANAKNELVLNGASSAAEEVARVRSRIDAEELAFGEAITHARRALFRFGFLSHLLRLTCNLFRGYYYSSNEFDEVERLAAAVNRFVTSCGKPT